MKYFIFLLLISNSIFAKDNSTPSQQEQYKTQIMAVEMAFVKMAGEEGLPKAFLHFAAEDAVLKRGKSLIKGTKEITQYFIKHPSSYEKFVWKPEFIDVSASGDLGYTYGPYQYEYIDKEGKLIKGQGVFHTVWKRQANGQWRYVWD